jgi:serine-type D-Ala-D-Ala carboxypeptidase/endopeptidase (penicillin-binding protein 4)
MISRLYMFLFLVAVVCSCRSVSKQMVTRPKPKSVKHVLEAEFEKTEIKFQDHSGFVLYDPENKETIYQFNADRYFTPGSNTKIFTFYTALRILGDSVPALKYVEKKDSLIFWGMGDPSLLYKFTFNNGKVYDFLKNAPKPLYFSNSNFYATPLGPGWAWDDYNEEFSAERSPFPLYGNLFSVQRTGSLLKVQPPYFDQFLLIGDREKKESVVRDFHSNNFQFHPGLSQPRKKEWDIPMMVDAKLTCVLLSDTLKRQVRFVKKKLPPASQPVYSIPTDSLYSIMMQESDNFIAEQLLLMCAGVVRDSLKTETAIEYSLANYLNDLPDKPIWVDGSGLSRYNLFTARTLVRLWEKIYELRPRERLFPLLATGGVNGTLKKWYKAEQPYIFGKTGTLSNNHALSGFIVTKSGKVLIFAFLNNNYVATTNDIRANMQNILFWIYDNY